jgi:hypothetical protein
MRQVRIFARGDDTQHLVTGQVPHVDTLGRIARGQDLKWTSMRSAMAARDPMEYRRGDWDVLWELHGICVPVGSLWSEPECAPR